MLSKVYNQFFKTKAVICALFLTTYLVGIALAGGNILSFALFVLVLSVYIILPGAYAYVTISKDSKVNIVYSFVIGMFIFAVCTAISSKLCLWIILKIFPLLLSIAFIIKKYKSKLIFDTYGKKEAYNLIVICSALIFVYTFLGVAKHAHPAAVGQLILSQDFMWTVGNAQSISMAFPPVDIRFSGVILKYHYFTELLTAGLSAVSGIPVYDILGFYIQPVMLIFLVFALYNFGRIYYDHEFKSFALTVSVFALSSLSLWKALPNGSSVFTDNMLEAVICGANSQALSLGVLAVFTTVSVKVFRSKAETADYIVMFIALIMLIFSKAPLCAIVIIALVCACCVNMLSKKRNIHATIISAVCAGIFAVLFIGYLSGGVGVSTQFSTVKTLNLGYFKNFIALFKAKNDTLYKLSIPAFMVLETVCIAPFQCASVIPNALKDLTRLLSLSVEKLWFYACSVGGVLAFFLTYHEAFSQVYFLYAGIFYLDILAIEYFNFDKIQLKNAICYCAIILSCITSIFHYTNFCGSGLRQFLFHYDILPKYPYTYIVKSEDEYAGEYLALNMAEGEMFITNRTHTGSGEGLSNVYTCFSGKQSYMEGFKYTVSNMGISFEECVRPKLEIVGKIFGIYDQTPADSNEIIALCKSLNIRYLVYSSQFEGYNPRFDDITLVFSNGTVNIYKVY